MRSIPGAVLAFALSGCGGYPNQSGKAGPSMLLSAETAMLDVGMNDVSVLWPLSVESFELLPRLTVGDDGMITLAQMDHLPIPIDTVFETLTARELSSELRIVGIRLDPCFRDVPTVGVCRPQMRLIVQALRVSGGAVFARDVAIHLFFELEKAEFLEVLTRLVATRGPVESITTTVLSVNPALQQQGLDGAYAQELKATILRIAVVPRLARIAFTMLRDRGNVWQFGAFNVARGDLAPVVVPGSSDASIVTFSMGVKPVSGFLTPCCGSIRPPITVVDNAANVVRMAKIAGEPLPDLAVELPKLDRIENPATHGPGSVDCVSCHVAMTARMQVLSEQPEFIYDAAERFASVWPLASSGSGASLSGIRAFGYAMDRPVISQRTVNETAAVVEALRTGN